MLTDPVDAFIVWLADELGEDVRSQVPLDYNGFEPLVTVRAIGSAPENLTSLYRPAVEVRAYGLRSGFLFLRVVEATRNLSSVEIDVDGVDHLIRTVTHESGPFTDEDADAREYTLGTFVVTGSRYSV